MFTPEDVKSMFTPRMKRGGDKRAWSISVESTWVPVLLSSNARGDTNIEPDVLGAPIRLAKDKDGSIKFNKAGEPMTRVHPVLAAQVKVARENYQAGLHEYIGKTMTELPDAYKEQVALAQRAAQPVHKQMDQDVDDFLANLANLAAEQAASDNPTPSENGETPKRRKVAVSA